MTETTESATLAITGRYLAVWSEPDPAARRAAIAGLWAPDGAEFIEGTQFRGHEELGARIAHAHEEFVASGRYAVTSAGDVTRHDDIVTLTGWECRCRLRWHAWRPTWRPTSSPN